MKEMSEARAYPLNAVNTQVFNEKDQDICFFICIMNPYTIMKLGSSVVEGLTRNRGAAGLSLTGITVLCP